MNKFSAFTDDELDHINTALTKFEHSHDLDCDVVKRLFAQIKFERGVREYAADLDSHADGLAIGILKTS